jgi:nucleoside-diphosphate-sugar epimerase
VKREPARKVLVTGASGLVGTAIVKSLLVDGWHVLYCSRRKPGAENAAQTWVPYDLAWHALPANFGAGADALVHAALDSVPNARDRNVDGTRLLLDTVRANGVRRSIFISSVAARADAPSRYGREKYAIERLFASPGDAIVRPGLVIGNGGLFRTLCRNLRRFHIVPLIDGGRQPLQTVLDEDLGGAVARIASEDIAGSFNIGEATPVEYRTFWEAVAARMRIRVMFLPVPSPLTAAAIGAAGILGGPAIAVRERLLGLSGMRYREPTRDSRIVPFALHRYDESIAIALPRRAE